MNFCSKKWKICAVGLELKRLFWRLKNIFTATKTSWKVDYLWCKLLNNCVFIVRNKAHEDAKL